MGRPTTLAQEARSTASCMPLIFRPILNKLGFDKLELVVSGGAGLPAETAALWHMYGVNVVEMYGQTEEAGGIIAGQRGPFPRPGNVGTPVDGLEVRLAEDGEVLVRGPDLFEGYWRNEDATREVKGADGWLRTGDVGEWRDGALRLIDRARDFLVTSGGKTISPSFIENALRASPYVAEAVVFGHGRKYLTAIIEIDFDTVADWARANDVAYTGFTSLTAHPRIEQLIKVEIDKANRRPRASRADQKLPHFAQGARSGRRRRAGDADAQGQAQADVRAFQDADRGHVRRQRGTPDCRRHRRCSGVVARAKDQRHENGRKHMLKRTLLGAIAVCTVAVPATAQDAYVVGLTGALTGPPSSTYAPAVDALRIYIDRVNAGGGVNGKKIQAHSRRRRRAAFKGRSQYEKADHAGQRRAGGQCQPIIHLCADDRGDQSCRGPLLFASGVCPQSVYPPADPLQFCTTGYASHFDSQATLDFVKATAKGPGEDRVLGNGDPTLARRDGLCARTCRRPWA